MTDTKLRRTAEVDPLGGYEVGDVIEFRLKDGNSVTAIAVQSDPDGMIFCFADCWPVLRPFKSGKSPCYGYEDSPLRNYLNHDILDLFPDGLRTDMCAFANGDHIRIPTEKEIFGCNKHGIPESEEIRQWEPMQSRRNRIAGIGSDGFPVYSYWLTNAEKSSEMVVTVNMGGNVSFSTWWQSLAGVRPVFKLTSKEDFS